MKLKETAARLMCFLVLLGCLSVGASADWYDDLKPNGTWVDIEGNDFVAETFYGVPALYNEDNRNYQCNEIVIRFYKLAYGLDIRAYNESDPASLTDGYKFVKTKSPKKGDIIFVSAEMRNSDMDHWAIVRDYSDGYITMFEQNARYDGKAAVGRQIKFPSDSYYIYTPVAVGDAPAPVLKNAVTGETDKTPTTEVQTTEKVTVTTTVPTTAKPTTTAAPTTTKAVTTKAVTTTKVTTTKPTATSQSTTQAVSETLTVTETTVPVTEESTTAAYTETTTVETQTFLFSQLNSDEGNKTLYIVGAVVGVAAIIGISALIMLKKRKA